MSVPDLTCEEIVAQILKGGIHRERITLRIFQEFEGFRFKIGKELNVPNEVTLDTYIDAIAELEYRIATKRFVIKSKRACSNFIYQVCYNKCVDYIRREGRTLNYLPINSEWDVIAEEEFIGFMKNEEIVICLEHLNETCKQLLILTSKGYSAKEIAEMTGLKNANSVGATKKTCINKLKDCIEQLRGK